MSIFQNSDDYNQYKLVKELKAKQPDFVNDFTDTDDLEGWCDLCDRKLVLWETDKLICPSCHIITEIKYTVVKHKPSREGPVDDDIEYGNDQSNISEYYSFQGRQEEKDPLIDSFKARGYQIITSTKK